MKKLWSAIAVSLLGALAGISHATEGGGSTYPAGTENFLVGAVPPPGFYVLAYGEHFTADELKDNRGQTVPIPGFSVRANVIAPRFIWSTDYALLGGSLVMHAIVPLVDLKISAGGQSQTKSGVGDITFGPAVAFHHSQQLHSVAGFDLVAPTGSYTKGDLANIGRNYWSVQPLYAVSYIDPKGFNGDVKATLNLNRRNSDTDYKSGTELWLDYALGWGLGNGWTVGVGGYLTRQLSDDKVGGARVTDNRARGASIGPSIKYDNGKGWFITAKLERDLNSRNRVEGSALWLKTSIPF